MIDRILPRQSIFYGRCNNSSHIPYPTQDPTRTSKLNLLPNHVTDIHVGDIKINQMNQTQKLVEALEKRIKELNAADVEFCKDRWDRPELHPLQKAMAREESNKVTFARQELQSILKQALESYKDGWVSVEERLPNLGQEVIVFCPNSRTKVTALSRYNRYEEDATFYWDNFYPGQGFIHIQEAVTHWQPLPTPPQTKTT